MREVMRGVRSIPCMRVAVFGYQSWGHRTLSADINAGHEVVLVVTHPASDHPYEQMWADSVEEYTSQTFASALATELPPIINSSHIVRDDFWGARRPECLVHRIAAQ